MPKIISFSYLKEKKVLKKKFNFYFIESNKFCLNLNESEREKTTLAKFEELNKNIILEKQVIKENTRLPQEFIDSMINTTSNSIKRKLFESYENSDVVKLLKEVK